MNNIKTFLLFFLTYSALVASSILYYYFSTFSYDLLMVIGFDEFTAKSVCTSAIIVGVSVILSYRLSEALNEN